MWCFSPPGSGLRRCWRWPTPGRRPAPALRCTITLAVRRRPPSRIGRLRQIHCSDEGIAPAAGAGSGGSGRRHPGLLLRSARIYGPGSRYRAGGRMGRGTIAQRSVQPPAPTAASAADGTFTITLASTGERWPVPGDKTIAQVLQEHGVAVPLSCEMGICGACLTPVREGTVDHRDTVQSEAEKQAAEQHIALCCSRSLSANLVIDLAG